jgi:hypothetical protein
MCTPVPMSIPRVQLSEVALELTTV